MHHKENGCFSSAIEKKSVQILHSRYNPKKELFFEERIAFKVQLQCTIAYPVPLHHNQQPSAESLNLLISVGFGG